ncbi:MAG: hypothetical protein FJW40_15460 [Acidobacteria bacterium]|nr:hypothetical protein [Acidobacteriota bacterium]
MRSAIFAIAALAGFLAGCSRPQPATVRVDPMFAPLLPAGTKLLVGIRVDQLRETATYQKLVAEKKIPQLDEFTRITGLDPRKDLWEIVIAYDGARDGLIMARGKFTEGGIMSSGMEPRVNLPGAREMSYKGFKMTGTDEAAVMYLNPTSILAGRTESLRRVLDARDGNMGRISPALMEKLNSIPASNQIWAVSDGLDSLVPLPELGSIGGLKSVPVKVNNVTAALDLRQGVRANVSVACGDDTSARRMHDAARGIIGLARLTTRTEDAEMLKFYDAIGVRQEANLLRLSADVPLALLEKVLAGMNSRMGRS